MAGWSTENKVALWVGIIGAVAVIVAAVIAVVFASSGGTEVDQKTGGDGTVCIGSTC
ncbi:hypothetical protein RM717_00190 [Streptomyces griseus]|uniref:Integral membrane protein n=1 Tax=Streptomyces stephensoniae TaxID=3375367 RepID=A0ABU2VTK7_9ACTN|nr:hypothetical protein [Streptomyces griseus]MDT0488921.1 hypothetical protein [Streptomyces griseus]